MDLLSALRAKDKDGLFSTSFRTTTYSTGFDVLDHFLGYELENLDEEGNVINVVTRLGFESGGFITVVGAPGTAKSTLLIQSAFNMIKPFESRGAFIYHLDVEQAASSSRILNVTGMGGKFFNKNYVMTQDIVTIQLAHTALMRLANMKLENREELEYETDALNPNGTPKKVLIPTIVILDSLPHLLDGDIKNNEEMQGNTHAARVARSISALFKDLGPYMKKANITVLVINHLKDNLSVTSMPVQAQTPYLKNTETAPGGKGPFYASHLYLKLACKKKLTVKDDGYDGMVVTVYGVKARTQAASGKFIPLVYEPKTGFSRYRSLLYFAEEMGLVEGRNPYLRFKGFPDFKFNRVNFPNLCIEKPELFEIGLQACRPILNEMIGKPMTDSEMDKIEMKTVEE